MFCLHVYLCAECGVSWDWSYTDGGEPPSWCCGWDSGPLEEQLVILSTKLSLWPQSILVLRQCGHASDSINIKPISFQKERDCGSKVGWLTWESGSTPASGCYNFLKNYFYAYIFLFLHVCLCTVYMPGACRGQKRASDPLELELQIVVSSQGEAGNWPWVLCKSNKCS